MDSTLAVSIVCGPLQFVLRIENARLLSNACKLRHQFADILNFNKIITFKRTVKVHNFVASVVTQVRRYSDPIQTGLMDFLRSSLTDGGSGRRGRGF